MVVMARSGKATRTGTIRSRLGAKPTRPASRWSRRGGLLGMNSALPYALPVGLQSAYPSQEKYSQVQAFFVRRLNILAIVVLREI